MKKDEYTPTIGLEIHAELNTKSKMFCGCKNEPHDTAPNEHVCEVCTAQPGTLPVINEAAVQSVFMVGNAIEGELAYEFTEFDRKNYFYPDIPKAYQISQLQYPLVTGGTLAGVAITRIHLEEDTARSTHDKSGSSSNIDFNRAGVPLMELVTEPVVTTSEEATTFAKELQLLLQTLGVSHANMERGEMRVEANISVSKTDTFGTKVEVKNLNSFKAVAGAIEYEINRQIEELENGGEIRQETRGWDENKSKTTVQRVKETSDDYRYFPDPDLPKLKLAEISSLTRSRLAEMSNKLPAEKRVEYKNLGLKDTQIETIISHRELDTFFAAYTAVETNKSVLSTAANYLTSDVLSVLEASEHDIVLIDKIEQFGNLMKVIDAGKITSRVAKDILPEVLESDVDVIAVIQERGLEQNNSSDELLPVIENVIANNTEVVEEIKNGKESAVQFLVGQVMKETRGAANPALAKSLLIEKITE